MVNSDPSYLTWKQLTVKSVWDLSLSECVWTVLPRDQFSVWNIALVQQNRTPSKMYESCLVYVGIFCCWWPSLGVSKCVLSMGADKSAGRGNKQMCSLFLLPGNPVCSCSIRRVIQSFKETSCSHEWHLQNSILGGKSSQFYPLLHGPGTNW